MEIKQKLTHAILGFIVGNAILLSAYFGFNYLTYNQPGGQKISFDQTLDTIKNKEIKKVHIKSNLVQLTLKNGKKFHSSIDESGETYERLLALLQEKRVTTEQEPANNFSIWTFWLQLTMAGVPFATIILLFGIFVRLGKSNNQIE